MRPFFRIAVVAFAMLCGSSGAAVAPSRGVFGVVADFHFDPLIPAALSGELRSTAVEDWASLYSAAGLQSASPRGSDTNHVLLFSALSSIAKRMAAADFVIVPGDLLAHRFGEDPEASQESAKAGRKGRTLAQDTHAFVIEALRKALPGKPMLVALGNNDADCGDYAIEPGGPFLAATLETVRKAAGGQATSDFDRTYRAGGYYEVRHPTVQNAAILVLNDVLWSRRYENRCGASGLDEARNQMEWLRSKLAEHESRGSTVWLVHHIPWGIDAYSSLHSGADDCPAGVTPFLRSEISAELIALLHKYADTITASFSAHAHIDDFRLLRDANGKPSLAEKIAPAISPIAGQDPGFLVFTYDALTGAPLDYTSYRLANLEMLSTSVSGDWREDYVFTKAFSQERYSPSSVGFAWEMLKEPGAAREVYHEHRKVRMGERDLKAYSCAIGFLQPQEFARCYCPDP